MRHNSSTYKIACSQLTYHFHEEIGDAERISRAEEDRTAGVLNLVKAAKELDGMDLEHLAAEIAILRQLEGDQKAKEAGTGGT